jgi:hypothetical protein
MASKKQVLPTDDPSDDDTATSFSDTPTDDDDSKSDEDSQESTMDDSEETTDDEASDDDSQAGAAAAVATGAPMFKTKDLQDKVQIMLEHLQEWWEEQHQLLDVMSNENLPCDSLRQMSDKIDTLLDNSLDELIKNADANPAVFPVGPLVGLTKAIKKYTFLKVGQLCCQKGRSSKCGPAAKAALQVLARFRDSATDVYAELLKDSENPSETEMDTPEIENLIRELHLDDMMTKPRA